MRGDLLPAPGEAGGEAVLFAEALAEFAGEAGFLGFVAGGNGLGDAAGGVVKMDQAEVAKGV